ncbi:sensor domain-containing protein [Streptomyces sp. NPDC018031]|uniref:sensor domain-containing protein n=1 Tax=Streptomyces sp. NPDC018031 TaxID=3365033 RepID=UPI0037B411F7
MTEMTPSFAASRASSSYAGRDAGSYAGRDAGWDAGRDSAWDRPAPGRLGRFGRELGYLLVGLPLGICAFTVAVTGFALGVGTFVTVLGLPVLMGTLAAARGFAGAERRRVEAVTGRALPPHHYREAGGTGVSGWLRALRDPQSWRDLLHMVVSFPLRVVCFSVAVTWTLGGVGQTLYATWSWSLPRDEDETGLLDLMFGIDSRLADIAFNTAMGVVLLATAIPMIRLLALLQTGLSRGLLTNPGASRRHGHHG